MDAVYLDWLRLTIPAETFQKFSPLEALKAFGLYRHDMLEMRRSGFLGWKVSCNPLPFVTYAYGGQNGTACIDITAQGLKVVRDHIAREYPESPTLAQWVAFMINKWGARVTRCDIAFDDLSGVVDLNVVWEWLQFEKTVMHFTKYGSIQEFGKAPDDRKDNTSGQFDATGRTIYIGKRSSESFIRFYDKAAERIAQGAEPDGMPDSWIRCELELKRTTAHVFMCEWLAGQCRHPVAIAYLRSKIEFIADDQTDSNVSRAVPAEWWETFCESVEKAGIDMPKDEIGTIEDVLRWFEESAAPSLAMLLMAFGPDTVYAMVEEASKRMKKKHVYLLEEYWSREANTSIDYQYLSKKHAEAKKRLLKRASVHI
jgi:hypothetical protein